MSAPINCVARGVTATILGLALLATDLLAAHAAIPSANFVSSRRTMALSTAVQPADEPDADDAELDVDPLAELEQLLQEPVIAPALEQEVTTVTGQQSTVRMSAAAVFVVTQEMIRRSGARSIPEVLRMVPGLQVARVNSHQWAITSRGFNTNIAGLFATNNKLLVLIDGRTVYTPFFNGTYWDVQDVLLEDIDRVEVIRGPGATIWGANAVNGVINVITKPASDTQGGLVQAGGGTEERGFASARVGGRSGENLHYRVYGKWFERDASLNTVGPQFDDWRQGRGGFRIDWTPNCCDTLTLQGDIYEGRNGLLTPLTRDERVRGGNILGRWTRTFDEDHDVTLQFYYDRADRFNNIGIVDQEIGTYDIDFRHHFRLGCRHNIIWGLSYRSVHDRLASSNPILFFEPPRRNFDTVSGFVQDEITLLDDELFLTLGTKLLDNDFTDVEVQPSARLLWSPEPSRAYWAAFSRAVRTPSRVEHDLRIVQGAVPVISLTPDFRSEELLAYELGYREQPIEWFSWDLALFYNRYENLGSFASTPPIPPGLPIVNTNDNRGEGYGFEVSAQADITPCWRLQGWYSFLQLQIHPGPRALPNNPTAAGEDTEGSSPHSQFFLMSSHDLRDDVEFDAIGRYVDELPFQDVPAYVALDLRLAWRPTCCSEISVVGQNLLDAEHPEFGGNNQIQRGVYGMFTRTW